jgi:hypothetical protein
MKNPDSLFGNPDSLYGNPDSLYGNPDSLWEPAGDGEGGEAGDRRVEERIGAAACTQSLVRLNKNICQAI